MFLRQITDSALAQNAYLIGCQRTGELMEHHGAVTYLSAEGGPDWQFEWAKGHANARFLHDGDTFRVGNIELKAFFSAGHTPEHMSFLVTDLGGGANEPMGLLSGDFIFVGDVGRPDLLESAAGQVGAMEPSARTLYAIGVRPEATLAKAGLTLGERGGIRVDEQTRASDPHIWAVGDAVEVRANRQGRIAADAICGRAAAFHGTQGTAICGVFGLAVASTSASEKVLQRAGITDFEKIYLHAGHHAGYYPGAEKIHLKLIFRTSDGRIFGAQAGGKAGVDKRIDVLSMAIQRGATIYDLEEAELCYAPQFGSAKDPINFAGMIAANHLRGDDPIVHWQSPRLANFDLLDVRDPDEFAAGHAASARNLPLNTLRGTLGELSRERPLAVYCAVGARRHNAVRLLRQQGFNAANPSGGYTTLRHVAAATLG